MILLVSNEGQMCNQLIALASAYALGIEYCEEVICPLFDEKLRNYFMFESSDEMVKVKLYHSAFFSIVNVLVKKGLPSIKYKEHKYDVRKQGDCQFFLNWTIKDSIIFVKHQEEIRRFFAFKEEIYNYPKQIIYHEKDEVLIGVHMRRGDYKDFNNGIWYYTDEEYIHWMENLSKDRNVKFFLASNEEIATEKYIKAGLNICQLEGNGAQDLCSLSMCDFIMGPPSTFSWWASMYGEKPRLILENAKTNYNWSDFKTLEQRVEQNMDLY